MSFKFCHIYIIHRYANTAQKVQIAEYAAIHGATASARKFGIPPSVASYYHRKVFDRSLPKGRRPNLDDVHSTVTSE